MGCSTQSMAMGIQSMMPLVGESWLPNKWCLRPIETVWDEEHDDQKMHEQKRTDQVAESTLFVLWQGMFLCKDVAKQVWWIIYTYTYIHTYITLHYITLHYITYVHTYIRTYLHTYIPTYLHTYIPIYVHTYIPTYVHTYLRTYVRTYVHTYVHTYIRTYVHKCIHRYIDTKIHRYIDT